MRKKAAQRMENEEKKGWEKKERQKRTFICGFSTDSFYFCFHRQR